MITWHPKTLTPSFVGLALAALLGPFSGPGKAATSHPLLENNVSVRLRTDGFPTPLVIPGDRHNRSITSLEIQGELVGDGDGKGTITLDESPLTFNQFGDATPTQPKPATPSQVTFRRLLQPPQNVRGRPNEHRRLFEIVFADGSFSNRMRLVLDGTTGPHRLIISKSDWAPSRRDSIDQILDLHGLPELKASLPDAPLGASIHLDALSPTDGRLRRISLGGSPNGSGHFILDPNYLTFGAFGDISSTTLIGYSHVPITLQQLQTPDPTGKDRRLFEIVTQVKEWKSKYFLVLAPTTAGPHRLLIREGNTLKQIVSLHDPDRRYQLTKQLELTAVSSQEQRAIGELRQAIGYRFYFKVESGAITELRVWSDTAKQVDPVLKGLTKLKNLELNSTRLGAEGLTNLRHLTQLETLRFSHAQIADTGLEPLKYAPQLKHLAFYCCQGLTDDGLAHLRGLKNLTFLWLYSEDYLNPAKRGAPRITDAGLERLKGLTNLERLNLGGQSITDAGLERLKGLTKLKELSLFGEDITDAGLEHLSGLTRLQSLHLNAPRVTPEGKAALKAKLPMLKFGY